MKDIDRHAEPGARDDEAAVGRDGGKALDVLRVPGACRSQPVGDGCRTKV